MHVHLSEIKGFQSIQFEPEEEVEDGEFPVESASTNELRQGLGSDLVHGVDDTTGHLDPTDHLRPVERALMLTEFDRLVMPLRDQGEEIVSEAPVRTVPVASEEPDQLHLGTTILDRRDGIPRILAREHG